MKVRYWAGISAALVLLFVLLFNLLYDGVRRQAEEDLQKTQKVMMDQAAGNITRVFESWTRVLSQLSVNAEVAALSDKGRAILAAVFSNSAGELTGISRMDARGRILFTIPEHPEVINRDISAQDHVKEILMKHKPVVSGTFQAVQGYMAIAYHYPVFRDGIFDGSVAVLLDAENITRNILQNVNIGKTGYAWIISADGMELYCRVPGHIGHTVMETARGFDSVQAMARKMLAGESGFTAYTYNQVGNKTFAPVLKLAYYRVIPLGNTFWSIVAATPASEVSEGLAEFRGRLLLIFGLFLAIAFGMIFLAFRAWSVYNSNRTRGENEARLHGLAQNIADGLVIVENGKTVYASPQTASITGCDLERIIGMPPEALLPESIRDRFQELVGGAPGQEEGRRIIYYQSENSAGIRKHIRVSSAFNSKAPFRYYLVFSDQSEQRKNEETLRSIFEASPVGISLAVGQIMKRVNLAFSEITGYSGEELTNQPTSILFPDQAESDRVSDLLYRDLRENGTGTIETRFKRKDGRIIDVLLKINPVDSADLTLGLTMTVLDITQRKRMDEEIRKLNSELEELVRQKIEEIRIKDHVLQVQGRNALMGEMLHNISHQWRQPLNVIGVVIQNLLVKYDAGLLDHAMLKHDVEKGMRVVQHMSETINVFRNFYRQDAEKTAFPIRQVLERSISIVDAAFNNNLIELQLVVEEDVMVSGNPNEFGQVVLNLFSNARDALMSRVVREPRVVCRIFSEGGSAVLTVSDNAGGIPEEILGKIGTPYFTTKRDGTGIGLYMSRNIIEKNMGGKMRIGNIPGGTEVKIVLPSVIG